MSTPTSVSKAAFWGGWVLCGLPLLFLLMDAVMKFAKPKEVVEATTALGYPEGVITGLGVTLLACTVLAMVPRTAVLGTILLTGYLGGAVASHVRMGAGAFPILFPVFFGALLWGGLWLREPRLRELAPIRRGPLSRKELPH